MENKEPRIFKTLVHKETGEFSGFTELGELGVLFNPKLYSCKMTIGTLEHWYQQPLSGYNLKEVVVITREEYERLKGEAFENKERNSRISSTKTRN